MVEADKPKILLVDDKPENLLVLEKILSPLNVVLVKANSGNEALALTLEHDFMLVLLDVQMPGMDGYEVLEMLSWDERTKYIPVIFVTANYADEKHELKGYESGAVDYLFKPINKAILLGKVKVFIELYEQRLQYERLQQRIELILDSAGEGIFGLDTEGKINFINPAACQLLGRSEESIIGECFSIMLPEAEANKYNDWHSSDIYQSTKKGDVLIKDDEIFIKSDNSEIPVEYTVTPMESEEHEYSGVVAVFSDITLRKTVEEQLTHLALYDHLTELPNRLLFEKSIHQVLSRAERHQRLAAIMFIDLDHFKQINDTLGHDVGDLLLQGVAQRITLSIRESDIAARLGGDEFAIILDEIEKAEDSAIVAEKIIESMRAPFNLNGHEVHTSPSIGIAIYPISGTDSETLMKNADLAMYRAKKQGRNNFCFFTEGMNEEGMHKLNLTHSLRSAVDNNELYMCYQPKLDLETNSLYGLEALVRWNHPHLGVVMPKEFISIAEEIGIMVDIGNWIINQVCQEAKKWLEQHPAIECFSINISSHQFIHKNLINTIETALETNGLMPEQIELEVTESAIMENTAQADNVLKALHDMGVRISVDDFGTGYSSINYLKRLPIDILKIDQTFIADIGNDYNDESIIKAIIALAHSMGLKVVAEGVETEDQKTFLKKNQCDYIQGFLYSKPLNCEELDKFLKQYSK